MTILYGFQTEPIDGLAKALHSFDCEDHRVIPQANRDPGDLAEVEFAAWAALLYIEGPAPKALGQRLANCIPAPVLLCG